MAAGVWDPSFKKGSRGESLNRNTSAKGINLTSLKKDRTTRQICDMGELTENITPFFHLLIRLPA